MSGDTHTAYVILVSSIPALYRSWKASPNEMALNLNRVLLDRAIEWVQTYQQDMLGRAADSFEEYLR